jgi:general secretion pathway protein D
VARAWRPAAALLLAGVVAAGCAAKIAYRQGQHEARRGNWDLAVARLSRALQKDPNNIGYKITLENARVQASRQHYAEARRRIAADDLAKAAEELDIATKYDPGNKAAADDLTIVRERIARREEERQRLSQFDAMKSRAQAAPLPVPVLSPRSTAPINLKFTDTSLEKIFETLSRLSGVNILFDQDWRDKRTSVNLTNVTFEEALDKITFVNRLFYKVLDPNTLIIVQDTPAKRRAYEDVLLRTFYLQNAETKDVEPLLKLSLSPNARVGSNATLGAITIIATPDELALAQRIIESNDKSRGEVMVEVEILEVNRNKVRQYGIELSNYGLSATFAPTGVEGELDATNGLTNLRAHVLSSLNLADFVVSVPSAVFARFLQTENTARILATPRLRAAEGKKTTLKIGTEVPIPVTTFTATQAGSTTFAPATSFNYRNVGVTLELTPRVNAGGDISLELNAEFSSIGSNVNVGTGQNPLNVPTFLTRSVNGILRVRDGETSLIGGLVQGREATTMSGFIGLQDIPVLNRIFPSTKRERDDTEILISLTPHLVRAPRLRDEDLATLFVGVRDLVRVPGARPPLFGPPEPAPSPGGPTGTTVAPLPVPTPEPTPIPPLGPAPTSPRTPSPPPPPSISAPAGSPPEPIVAPAPTPPPASPVPAEAPPTPSPTPAAPAPAAASARLTPASMSVRVGSTATVSVVVMGAQDVSSVDLSLAYDPTVVEAVDVGSGPLLTLDGTPVGVEKGMEPGRVRARFTRTRGTSGSGVIATITFRGAGPGTSALTPEALTLGTTSGPVPAAFAGVGRIVVTP